MPITLETIHLSEPYQLKRWCYCRQWGRGRGGRRRYLRIVPVVSSGQRLCRKTPAFPAVPWLNRFCPTCASQPTASSVSRLAPFPLVSPPTAGSPTGPPSLLWHRPPSLPPRRSVQRHQRVSGNNWRHRHVTAIQWQAVTPPLFYIPTELQKYGKSDISIRAPFVQLSTPFK